MTVLVTLLVFVVATLWLTSLLIKGEDRQWVTKVMLIGWVCLFPLLVLMHFLFPLTTGGDDENYFYAAAVPYDSLADYFDMSWFAATYEQPGYAWLLSILYQFTGANLLALKLLNLALFMLLIPVWYLIGVELDSRKFGRMLALVVLLLPPLWYYWIFLLKDILVTLLQSIFLLGAVQISAGRKKGGWMLVLSATLALIPFRAPLVMLNILVLGGSVTLTLVRRGKLGRSFVTAIMSAIVIVGIVSIASNPELMAVVGIYDEGRMFGTEASAEKISDIAEESVMNRGLFPIMYIVSETSGLNLKAWADFDTPTLRGVLAIPWITIAVPFFVIGLFGLVRRDPQTVQRGGIVAAIRSTRLIATPWGVTLIFLAGYMALSWAVGDTTRWRLPDMPVMAAVATAGWLSMAERIRRQVLMLWMGFTGVAIALFNLLRGM